VQSSVVPCFSPTPITWFPQIHCFHPQLLNIPLQWKMYFNLSTLLLQNFHPTSPYTDGTQLPPWPLRAAPWHVLAAILRIPLSSFLFSSFLSVAPISTAFRLQLFSLASPPRSCPIKPHLNYQVPQSLIIDLMSTKEKKK
jgi:hypothetical protein